MLWKDESMSTIVRFGDDSGQVIRHANRSGDGIAARHLDVWLPPGYDSSPDMRYPVIYMHDGQNLFDPTLASGGLDWGVDEAIARLMRDTSLPGAIVVGVWNSTQRWRDYMPSAPLRTPAARDLLARFEAQAGGAPLSDHYLRFLTAEVKPLIDATYRTLPEQPHTCVMGSSMGGLISLYALCSYPDVFGGAGCLSTHWPIGGDLLVDALGAMLPSAGRHRLYFDYGTATLDADYEPFQQRMDRLVRAAGYTEGQHWITHKFEGAEHNERAWRERVHLPLRFLLEK
jgi:predicted alpha/beta superfamily hydrolase